MSGSQYLSTLPSTSTLDIDHNVVDIRRGTLPYMAPELVNDPTHVSEKADVWSLGMVRRDLRPTSTSHTYLNPHRARGPRWQISIPIVLADRDGKVAHV